MTGDKILSVNGEETEGKPYKIVDLISGSETNELVVNVERNNNIIQFNVVPQVQKSYKIDDFSEAQQDK